MYVELVCHVCGIFIPCMSVVRVVYVLGTVLLHVWCTYVQCVCGVCTQSACVACVVFVGGVCLLHVSAASVIWYVSLLHVVSRVVSACGGVPECLPTQEVCFLR